MTNFLFNFRVLSQGSLKAKYDAMATAKKTWTEKLNANKEPIIKRIEANFADIPAGSNMYIATPRIIAEYVNQIPKGKSVSIKTLRNDLAIENRADHTCPVTTGIFLRIVAEAAYEAYQKGADRNSITPFWRAIDEGSNLAKKLSFGTELLTDWKRVESLC